MVVCELSQFNNIVAASLMACSEPVTLETEFSLSAKSLTVDLIVTK